ncbi:antibiotic biosynthesis monooxygenase family protein [Flammeovirga agarivorans]|uniref:Antibiotic biosynthesis monooxygenase n=1 Tax=Flammeovirga agarivorans TaxID=2726742 RepID=A0A7X8SPM9_9BACT|nr:antibiotic biosynthesis monooxygenase [Flammeovirga agarivorans]NLR94028.1 antibiotic biosynthesis monooxygenase [Flammeovirga agarivorans]
MFANTPTPPYYAVIFTSTLTSKTEGYEDMANLMIDLASQQDGFLGVEGAREEVGITVSYWKDLASIKEWKSNTEHQVAQKFGKEKWYDHFITRIAKVEREYSK